MSMDSEALLLFVDEVNAEFYDLTSGDLSEGVMPFTFVSDGASERIDCFGECIFCCDDFNYYPDEDHKGKTEREAFVYEVKKKLSNMTRIIEVVEQAIDNVEE